MKFVIYRPRYTREELKGALRVYALFRLGLFIAATVAAYREPMTSFALTAIALRATLDDYLNPVEVEEESK